MNSSEQSRFAVSAPPENGALFRYDQDNVFENNKVSFQMPKGAIYDSFYFEYDTLEAPADGLSVLHIIHKNTTPIHSYCKLKIKPDKLIPEDLLPKCLLVNLDDEGEMSGVGGTYVDGFVEAKIRDFGEYMVYLDTIAPEVKPRFNEGNVPSRLRFTIKDELSGIKSYRGELNGQWILMEYDAKNDLLFCDLKDKLKAGNNSFKLVVTDNKDNVAEFLEEWQK
jgi:hypothetical protein